MKSTYKDLVTRSDVRLFASAAAAILLLLALLIGVFSLVDGAVKTDSPQTSAPTPVVSTSPPVPPKIIVVTSPSPSPSPSPVIVISPSPSPSPVRVKETPVSRSKSRGLPSIALRVADCESGDRLKNGRAVEGSYDLRAENGTSTASGKYQAINSTWRWVMGPEYPPPASRWSEAVQDEFFLRLWDGGKGASHWSESRGCWG